jgi:hypothetical protein
MSLQPTPAEPEKTDRIEADRDYYRAALREMTEIAVDLARMIHSYAKGIPGIDLSEPVERLNRNVRRNVMLAEKLGVPPKDPSKPDRISARKKIIRDVEDTIQCKAPPGGAETLRAELLERLESPDIEDDIAKRSIPEIVTEICRDLGIGGLDGARRWKRRTPHDVAILNAHAARPATPPTTPTPSLTGCGPPPSRV